MCRPRNRKQEELILSLYEHRSTDPGASKAMRRFNSKSLESYKNELKRRDRSDKSGDTPFDRFASKL